MQNTELSLDQKLAEKHLFNQLYDQIPNPEKAQELLNEMEEQKTGMRAKAASYINERLKQRMSLQARKENIQRDERRVW